MGRLAKLLRIAAFAAAWAVLLAAAALLTLERTGFLARRIRAALAERLGEPVALHSVRLAWFEPSVELRGLELGPGLRAERLRLGFGRFDDGSLGLVEVEVEGGEVVLAPALLERLGRLRALEREPLAERRHLPTIVVRGVRVDLSHPAWGEIPLGTIEALCEERTAGMPVLRGRILPGPRAAAGGDRPEIFLGGSEVEPGLFELFASAEGLPITVDSLPMGTVLERFRRFAPRASVALAARARLPLEPGAPAAGELRARLSEGSFLPPDAVAPVEDLRIDLEARWEPRPGDTLASREAWDGRARLGARWRETEVAGWALLGRSAGPELAARGWATAGGVPVTDEAFAASGLARRFARVWEAFEPRGEVDVTCGLELPSDWVERAAAGRLRPAASIEVTARGAAETTFRGFPDERTGERAGLPLPLEGLSGRMVSIWEPDRARRGVTGFLELSGTRSGGVPGTASGRGLALTAAEPGERMDWSLELEAREVGIDERLRDALQSLAGTQWIWPTFAPSGGGVSATARIARTEGMKRPAAEVVLEVTGADAAWAGLPAPLYDVSGRLEILLDPDLAMGVGFDAAGRTTTAERVRVRGRVQDDPASPAREPAERIQTFEVEASGVALRGVDRDAVAARFPGAGAGLEHAGPAGKADVRYVASRALPGGPLAFSAEIAPREVQVSPPAFQVHARNVRGRVLVAGETLASGAAAENGQASDGSRGGGAAVAGRGEVETRVQPLVGEWPGETWVALSAAFPAGAGATMELYGAGIAPANRGLVGALRQAFGGEGGYGGLDLSALEVDGRVDFGGEVRLSAGEGEGHSRYRVYLRDNGFETGSGRRFGLERLNGILVQSGGELHGARITAVLGRTPIVLEDARFFETGGSFRMETRLAARDLPLDREHLRFFLDEVTVAALVEELGFHGSIDIDGASLSLAGRPQGGGEVRFRGRVSARDAGVDFGLPVGIERASATIEELVFEGGHVRAWASVAELDGTIAGRRLLGARMLFTYVEPHLSILDLDGGLEGGSLRQLGGEAGRGGPAFSIDLKSPFPFEVGLRLDDVEVAGLLRGLFESDFASRGLLTGDLRLVGSLDRLTGITGDGSVQLRDSTLWSIPVMRDLFSQLGFDDTAVFERMRSRFRIQDGVVHMNGIHVYSPLLQLVGAGTLDLDGRLNHDLQVRYSLVDRLGPFTRLLYFIQNNLLSVAVRGDMSRPKVILKGVLSIFQRVQASSRDLPLPGVSPVPERF